MDRDMKVEVGGKEITLALNFGAADEISKEVADPFEIAREAMLEAMMLEAGVSYDPKFKFTLHNVPDILYIGQKHAGGAMTLDEVRGLVMMGGLATAKGRAIEYLGAMLAPQSEEITGKGEGSGKK